MEWIGMRKLARASSLSDISNVVYYSDEYWASFMNFPKMQYCTMQVTLLNIIHSLRFNMSYMIISAEHYAAAGNQLHKLRSQAQGCCFHHRLHSRPSSIIFLLLCSKLKVKILEKSSYRVPQKYRLKVYGSEGHKNGANQILILCMFFSTLGHLV